MVVRAAGSFELMPSMMSKVEAGVQQRDGVVGKDDNLDLLLLPGRPAQAGDSLTYFDVKVNPMGTVEVQSAKYKVQSANWKVAARRNARDWTVEMSCPLADLGTADGRFWGINASRFQAATSKTTVWQAPFEHDPHTFGLLSPPK